MKESNWWTDPKNAEEVKKLSWWEHPENKTTLEIPISIVNDGHYWVVANNKETKALLGESLSASAQGKTKEEAISKFFSLIKMIYNYHNECRLKDQRWVPFRKGDWKHTGGTWFSIFGIHLYFRNGKGMKGGWYIPFTKLNILITSDWATYKNWKNNRS